MTRLLQPHGNLSLISELRKIFGFNANYHYSYYYHKTACLLFFRKTVAQQHCSSSLLLLNPAPPPLLSFWWCVLKKKKKMIYAGLCQGAPMTVQTTFKITSRPRWPFKTHQIPLHDKKKGSNKQIPLFIPFLFFSILFFFSFGGGTEIKKWSKNGACGGPFHIPWVALWLVTAWVI